MTVKNIGKVPGKEVVQLYYSAPQGKLGKPARELAAFKKTKLLSPGESEAIALSFDIGDMASFDDLGKIKKSAFVLEKGTYSFYLGNSVRATEKLRYDFVLSEDIITKESKPLCRPFKLEKRLSRTAALKISRRANPFTPAARTLLSKQPRPKIQSCSTKSAKI